jgi:putative glutamine amidotransferase
MQLLNVARGGDLHQHLPDLLEDAAPHKSEPGTWTTHPIELEPGSRLAAILGESVEGTSCHHQSPDHIGADLVVSGRAPDGVVEGIELPGRRMAVGVLWHPEEDGEGGGPLFRELVECARAYRSLRAA